MPPAYNQNPSKTDLFLTDAECHLWQIPLSANYVGLLREAELVRYQRMKHPDSREDFAASQAGLRAVLGYYVSRPPGEVHLLRRERGKPFLPEGPEFNLSHSAGLVFAVVASQPVGLDVESAARRVGYDGLAAKFFSPAEERRIAGAPAAARNRMFLRHWVCKEATVKLSGDGIFRGLRDAEIFLEPGLNASGQYRGRAVWLKEFRPAPGCLAAIASWQPLSIGNRFRL
jgi:4'-phosphopantetheinyl transferase